jgi:PAS domain-containing protein
MEKYMFGISIDEALAKSQERLAEYTKNILEESDSFHAVEITKLKEVIETLKAENARLREALEQISGPTTMWDGFSAKLYWNIAREALRGDITPDKGGE